MSDLMRGLMGVVETVSVIELFRLITLWSRKKEKNWETRFCHSGEGTRERTWSLDKMQFRLIKVASF